MSLFDPFSKSFDSIEVVDLRMLREVAEGWYVEYKAQLPPSRKESTAGKSLCAFSNHYGGWLFYGIGSDKLSRFATDFPGIAVHDVSSYEQTLRDAARHHVNPSPFFRSRVLTGPCAELNLPSNRAILLVQIPSGHNAPYIHSSGRIYRRIADSSDPKPETDRTTLDLLYERGRRDRSRLADFITRTPALSEYEGTNLSFVQFFLMLDPLGDRGFTANMSFSRFAEIMSETSVKAGGLPFENAFTMMDGFIARQVSGNNPYAQGLTWRYYDNTACVITLPFSSTRINSDIASVRSFFDGYKYADEMIKVCIEQRLTEGTILDTNYLFPILCSVLCKFRYLISDEGYSGTFYAKATLQNIWRRVPFLDLIGYPEFLSLHGIPVIQEHSATVPPGTEFETFIELVWREFSESTDDTLWEISCAHKIFDHVLRGLGLPSAKILLFPDDSSIMEIFELNDRAKEVSQKRKANEKP